MLEVKFTSQIKRNNTASKIWPLSRETGRKNGKIFFLKIICPVNMLWIDAKHDVYLQMCTEIIGSRRLVPIKRFKRHKVECISYIHRVATTILSYTINLLLKCTRICYSTLRYPTTAAYLCLHWQKNYAILIITLISLCAFKNSSGVTLTSSHCTLICF